MDDYRLTAEQIATLKALHKNGTSPFTFVMKFGHVTIKRQRLRHSQTGKTVKPSAILWQTSHHHHISQQTVEAACEASQVVSYRKAARQKQGSINPQTAQIDTEYHTTS